MNTLFVPHAYPIEGTIKLKQKEEDNTNFTRIDYYKKPKPTRLTEKF